MLESSQLMYVARSPHPLTPDELAFYIHGHGLPDLPRVIRLLVSKGYSIIGYMAGDPVPMMHDITGKPVPNEGAMPGDLVVSGPMASALFPANRHKFMPKDAIVLASEADFVPIPNQGEEGVRT